MKMHRMPMLAGLAALVLLSALGTGCGATPTPEAKRPDQVLFALDWVVFGRHAGYFTALDKGYYADNNIAVNIVRGYGSSDSIKRVAAGKADFVFGDIGSLVAARANDGVKVKALAVVYGNAPHSFFFHKDTGIKSPKDLEGQTIAAAAGDANKTMFPAFASVNGIDPDKVNWLIIDGASKTPMFLARQAQVITEYKMHRALLEKEAPDKGIEFDSMTYSDFGLNFYSNGILTTEDTIKNRPDLVRRFVAATIKGLEYAFEHPQEAADILKKYHPEVDVVVAAREVEIVKELAMTTEARDKGIGYMDPQKMTATRDLVTQAMGLKTEISPTDVYTNEFLPKK